MVYPTVMKKLIFIVGMTLIAAGCAKSPAAAVPQDTGSAASSKSTSDANQNTAQRSVVISKKIFPIADAFSRVTKKTFGTYVTPQNSPVSPEKFTGYHTGVDFETFANEKDATVNIYAVCAGKAVVAGYVGGYGGVVIQRCTLNGQPVTVLYGHLNLTSIKNNLGKQFLQGDKIGILGAGYSYDTAGERKHLHLGVHKGSGIEYRGYVQNKAELSSWLNYLNQTW